MRALKTPALAAVLATAVALLAGAAAPAFSRDLAPAPARGVEHLGPNPPASPRRIITLAPSLTDLVVAMGDAGRLVGVTRYDDAPEVAKLPRVGGFLDPSPEAVLALRPDLVLWIADGGAIAPVKRIAALGVPVLAIPVVSIDDVLATARLLGRTLAVPEHGERVARDLEAALGAAKASARAGPRRRVLFVVGRDPLVVAGPGSYPDQLLAVVGAENVVKDARPWPVYPLEQAVGDDPALVIDAAVLEPREGIAALSAIPAVRRGAVFRLPDDSALRPGPRLPRALAQLQRALAEAR